MSFANFSHKIQVEQVHVLYQQIKFALWAESFAAISLFLGLWGIISPALLISWLLFNLIFCGLYRHLLVFYYQKFTDDIQYGANNVYLWLILFGIGVLLSGISWGLTGSLLIPKTDTLRQTFTVFLLIGVTCAANPLYSSSTRIYALFLFPAMLPFALWLFWQGGLFILLGVLSIVYILIMLLTSFYSYQLIFSSLYLRYKNIDLVEDLSNAMQDLEQRTQQSQESLSLVRATLEATTDGILVVNAEMRVGDYNQKFSEMWHLPGKDIKGETVKKILDFLCHQLIDPNTFSRKITELYLTVERESFDELEFKDGRVFECYSHPQFLGKNCVGRVWSFRDVTNRKLLEAKLLHQANFDSLTSLPNRALVLDRISQAIAYANRSDSHVGILFMDIDRFKRINDTRGHSHGDKLLKSVADRLIKCVRENDTVAREGGDEFIIILTGLPTEEGTVAVALKCLAAMNAPFIISGTKFNVTLSIGISFYPRDGRDAETLIRNADIAMYRAKELGRNNFQFFTEELNRKIQNRLLMENQLHESFDKQEFSLVYQPIISIKSSLMTGVEALLRWHHPQLGEISPAEFVPVAEESGMIFQIGEWVLRTACMQIKAWQDQGLASLQVSINLSAQQFKQFNFFEHIQMILAQTQLSPQYLALELTESIIMDDIQKNIKMLNKLKDLGIEIVIDDFGTGYSSLNYLKQLPLNKLKIDKTFIQDIPMHADDSAITSAIIALAGRLNLKVIAEGVESQDQLNFLIQQNCDEIQGFYFSGPLTAEEFTALLIKNKKLKHPLV